MKITASQNGPYLIEVTEAKIKKGDTEEKIDRKMIALCRCGHSANKPFCDGAHKKEEFKADPVDIEIT